MFSENDSVFIKIIMITLAMLLDLETIYFYVVCVRFCLRRQEIFLEKLLLTLLMKKINYFFIMLQLRGKATADTTDHYIVHHILL